jgi:membrane associated rhomboid family serine protease
MLDDRDYMRQPEYRDSGWRPSFRFRWSWTVTLLAAYLLVFLAELICRRFFPHNHFFHGYEIFGRNGVEFFPGYLPLSVEGLEHGFVWQLLTYQFMHEGWLHLFLNSWVIYFFGRELEEMLGGKKFLALMFSSGIVGGLFQILTALLWPQYFGGAVVGASACGFGLIAAFALMFPERELTMLIFFVIPLTLRAKTLLIGSAVIAVAGFAFHDFVMPGVAHAAHLGGMAMGWFFVRKILQGDWSRLGGALRPAEKAKTVRPRAEPVEKTDAGDFLADEVDAILDKISAHGLQSLTTREREILESARKKMTRR